MSRRGGRSRRALGLFLLAALLAACGGGGEAPAGPGFDVSGRYQGTQRFVDPPGAADVTLRITLVQVGNLVNGSFSSGTSSGAGDSGSVTGSVSGTIFTARTTSTVFQITCDLQAAIGDAGVTLSGTFQCSNGESGTFTLSRT